MIYTAMASSLVAATFLAAAGMSNTAAAADTHLEANKRIVEMFTSDAWGNKDEALVRKLISADFIQHNPHTGDGPEAIIGTFPYISPQIRTVRIIAEGDLVVSHNDSTGWGDGKRYVSFDIFRVKNGKIIEHWDAMQPYEEKTLSGHSMIDGAAEIKDLDKTELNKKVVGLFMKTVVYGGDFSKVANFISSETYIQHNPHVGDGLGGFADAMAEMHKKGLSMTYDETFRVIAEGDFVFVHSKGTFGGKKVVFADLMRLENGMIVEHWDAIQPEVPAHETKSGHDMFTQVSN